jgi:1-acyl-sn-glycerol-3-phosphate acyltransferase
MGYFLLKYFSYPFVKLLWGGKLVGLDNVPKKGSFIIAANHSSYLDFILLFCFIPRKVRFLAAEKFFHSKFWLPIMTITQQIRVDRNFSDKKDVYFEVKKLFNQHGVLGIFPEGTRSRSGAMQKAYNGVAKFAFEYGVPVLPVGIIGAHAAFPPHAKYPKFSKVNINIGAPIIVKTNNFEYETLCIMKNIAKLSDKLYE